MQIISTKLQEEARIVFNEILESKSEYFHPKAANHVIFQQAYMKFLNRNLNYFDFENMVAQTDENDPFNPEFPKTLEFCNFTKKLTNTVTPYGRMCIWYIPPKTKIWPHVDNFTYHFNIIRNIFIVSKNILGKHKIIIKNTNIESFDGLLFQFSPATDLHSFINDSDEPFYFLGYDFWIESKLVEAKLKIDINNVINNPSRLSGFGARGTKFKYMSEH